MRDPASLRFLISVGVLTGKNSAYQLDTSKPALSEFRALLVAGEGGQAFTHEQSERLLQQFVQWGQKPNSPDKP